MVLCKRAFCSLSGSQCISITCVVFVLIITSHAQAEGDPQSQLDIVLNASGGLTWQSGEAVGSIVEQIQNSPGAYLPLIRREIRLNTNQLDDPTYQRRIQNAVELLSRIGNAQAVDVLRQAFAEFQEASKDTNLTESQRKEAVYVKNLVVNAMASLNTDVIVNSILADLSGADVGTYHVYLQYLEKVAQTHAIADMIRSKAEATGREDWAITRRTLATIEARAAGPIDNGNDDEPAIGPSNEQSDASTGSRPTPNTSAPSPITQTEVSGAASTSESEPIGASALLWAGGAAGVLLLLVGAGVLIQLRRKHVDGAGPH